MASTEALTQPPYGTTFDEEAATVTPTPASRRSLDGKSDQESEKGPGHNTSPADPALTISIDDEITYEYLDFDTILPQPVTTSISSASSESPSPPDLKKYKDPFAWSPSNKVFTTILGCAVTITAAFAAGAYEAPATLLIARWGVSKVAYNVGITLFTIAFGIAPMCLAPFSELNGRRPVFLVSGVLVVVTQIGCARAENLAGMLVARFFLGIGASTFSTIVGGVISDIYHAKDRNTAMALFSGAALLGTGLGPLVAGFIVENTDYRWIFYLQAIVSGCLTTAMFFLLSETRGSVLLIRKANALNKYYEALEAAGYVGVQVSLTTADEAEKSTSSATSTTIRRLRWKVKAAEERGSLREMLSISLFRPFHLLFTEPVVFSFSLWVSFAWAVLYLQFSSIPLVFTEAYNFTLAQNGAVFGAMCIGAIISCLISIFQEPVAARFGKLSATPEGRLYFACVQSALLPIGLFTFAWTASPSIPWIVPCIAIAIATMGILSIYLAVFQYLADCYHRYASSAIAAQSFCRNWMGGVFPLVTVRMFEVLGTGGASSLLGGVAALLTVVPWVLVLFGPKIRAKSRFAMNLAS